eukprot:COSAG04_NODE_20286_length_397_cov_0.577181_2_plen_34_part_01
MNMMRGLVGRRIVLPATCTTASFCLRCFAFLPLP